VALFELFKIKDGFKNEKSIFSSDRLRCFFGQFGTALIIGANTFTESFNEKAKILRSHLEMEVSFCGD